MLNAIRATLGLKLKAQPDPKAQPGDAPQVYHEYFVAGDPDANGQYQWMARVYHNNALHASHTGANKRRDRARAAALAWAEKTKQAVRSA